MTLAKFFTDWKILGDPTRCFYCGVTLLVVGPTVHESHPHVKTKDHFVPKKRQQLYMGIVSNPARTVSVKVLSCFLCNNIKGCRTPEALRIHVQSVTGDGVFFAERLLNSRLHSIPDYMNYSEAAHKEWEKDRTYAKARGAAEVKRRREVGILPDIHFKNRVRKAMKENIWWNSMNSLGRLIWALQSTGSHPEAVESLRGTIEVIKSTLPPQFARKSMGVEVSTKIQVGFD